MYAGISLGSLGIPSSPYSEIGGPGVHPVMTTGPLAGPRVPVSSSDGTDEYVAVTVRVSATRRCLTGGLLETGDELGAGTCTGVGVEFVLDTVGACSTRTRKFEGNEASILTVGCQLTEGTPSCNVTVPGIESDGAPSEWNAGMSQLLRATTLLNSIGPC